MIPTHLSWSQGEQDAVFFNTSGRPSEDDYKNNPNEMFEDIRIRYGDVKIFVKLIGRRTDGANTNDGGTQSVRNAQIELMNELSYVHYAGDQYHVGLFDGVHPLDSGYDVIFSEEARLISAEINGNSTDILSVSNATRSGTTIQVEVSGADDIAPDVNIDGFSYIGSDGSEIDIVTATAIGTVITLTLDTTPIDQQGTLYYIYDQAETFAPVNGVVDSNDTSRVLRSTKIDGL